MISVVMDLEGKALSQYVDFDFNSMCEFNGMYLGAGENGISVLGGDDDNGADIDAFIETPMTDLGDSNQKRLRMAYVGYESTDELELAVAMDEVLNDRSWRTYTLKPNKRGLSQEGGRRSIGRDGRGRYFTVRIKNVEGCDFTLNTLEFVPVLVGRGRRG